MFVPILTIAIYHIHPKQHQLGVVLNPLMETAEKVQYQSAFAVTGAWQGILNHNTTSFYVCI